MLLLFYFFSLVLQIPVICIYGTPDSAQCWIASALTDQFSLSFIQALHGCIAIQHAHCVVTDASDDALGILDCNAAAQHAVLV